MQTLQPMQRRIVSARPVRAFRGICGSVISARFMPNASATPSPISRSASAGSSTREVAISGLPTRNGAASSAIAFRGTVGGGTMLTQPSNVDELPIAMCT